MNICLQTMTSELAHRYFQGFSNDPEVYQDPARYTVYEYSEGTVDAYCTRQQRLGRVHLAILLGSRPIGEILLKDLTGTSCTLSIHLQNDSVKNQGYGTEAEILALDYAFNELGLDTVYADALIKNTRSRRVLEKVGFAETRRDEAFCYYVCKITSRKRSDPHDL